MGSSDGGARFALAVAWRAALIGGLIFAALAAATHGLYATAVVAAAVAVVPAMGVARKAQLADQALEQFVDGLIADGLERGVAPQGLARLEGAIGRALDRVSNGRAERQRRIDYLQTLADTVSAALLVVDDEGRVELANRAARTAFGQPSRLTELGESAARRLLSLSFGAGEVVRLADGSATFATATGFATPDGGGRRLISLQRIAGELDAVELKAWQDLVRVLAHEMMNSLTPICALAEASAAMLDKDNRQAAEAMEVIARRGAGLIDFVGRYRKVFELPEPERQRMRLADLEARMGRLMAGLIAGRGLAYEGAVDPPGLVLSADPGLLEQAVINLLHNAIEALDGRAGGKVRLECRADGGQVVISVADNGPGLAPEDVEAAFVPFFTRKAAGSGIGLSLSRQIAFVHGGRLEYAGSQAGAVFRLVLPV